MSIYRYPFHIALHPYDGFAEMKVNKKGSLKVASVIVSCWILVEIFYRTMSCFDVNPFVLESVNFFEEMILNLSMYIMVCAANWCWCSLLDGKGRMKDIFVVVSYALVPYTICRFVCVLLSNLYTIDEQIIFSYCVTLSMIWSVVIAFLGLKEIHEYSAKKTLLSMFLTVLGLLIMLFLGLLLFMLIQQLFDFFLSVFFELRYL